MKLVHLVALLAVVQFLYFGVCAGRARMKYGIQAPATSGHEMFDRAYRVQMNTLELMVCFLPALLIASIYWPAPVMAAVGAVYLIGRLIYQNAYMKQPEKRGLGFLLSALPTFALLAAGLIGLLIR